MKRLYEKPEITKVKLKMEENVLCVCKGTSVIGTPGPQGGHDCIHPVKGPCHGLYA